MAQTAAASFVVLGIGGPLRLFTASPLVLPGPYAYFIYRRPMLLGWGIIQWLGGENFLLTTPRTLAAALSWKILEHPLIRIGHRATC